MAYLVRLNSNIQVYRKYTAPIETFGNHLRLTENFYFKKERPELLSILTLGEPIMDIISQIDEQMIEKYSLKYRDTVLIGEKDDKNAEIFEELEKIPKVRFLPGGSAQNTVRVLSWCLNMEHDIKKYKLSFLGSIGDDEYKNKIEKEYKELYINPIFEVIKDDKTSRCGVGIFKKEKLFATQLRASKKLSEEFVNEHLNEILDHQVLFIEGYMVSNKLDICKKLIEYFKRDKKPIILSLCAPFIVKNNLDKLLELANDADIITGNMEEAMELAGATSPDDVDEIFKNIFSKLSPDENRLLVVTHGDNGAYWGKYNYEEKRLEFMIQYFAVEMKEDEIEDLNGAGDAFLGGFLSRYMEGYSIHDCCKVGIEAATVIIKNVGCDFPKDKTFQDIYKEKK